MGEASGAIGPMVLFTDVPPDPLTDAELAAAGLAPVYASSCDPAVLASEGGGASILVNGFTRIDEALLASLPGLRMICLTSMGTDMVDLTAASERGVVVTSIPGDTAASEVASHAFALTLALLRGIVPAADAVAHGRWVQFAPSAGPRVEQLTLGLIGFGNIGRRVAADYGMHYRDVIAYDPFVSDSPVPGVRLAELDDVIAEADVLSLHLPLTDATAGLIGPERLARMKRGAILVNVSRGGLIDSGAVAAALDRGDLAGVALDVLEDEPPTPGHPLVGHPRAIITPHIAYLSTRTERRYREIPVRNAIAWTRGEPLSGVVVHASKQPREAR